MVSRRQLLAGAGAVVTLLCACAVDEAGITPPKDELFFPTGLALHPNGRVLYVSNGNADLRYNSGTLLALDLAKADACLALADDECDADPRCSQDPIGPARRNCDEPPLVQDHLRIGSFAGEIEIRPDGTRLYLPTRSDPVSITWVDLSDGNLDEVGEVVQIDGAGGTRDLPAEPFGMSLQSDCQGGRLLVTHLATGAVTMLADCDGTVAALATSAPLFAADRIGRRRAFAIAPRRPDDCSGPLYVTSSTSMEVATLLVDVLDTQQSCPDPADVRLVEGPGFRVAPPLDSALVTSEQHGTDSRGIAFSPDGERAWLASREPPSLILVDTSLEHGLPKNRPLAVAEVCPEPSLIRVREGPDGRPLVYVVCFVTSEIYVVDGEAMEVADVIKTGRGPAGFEIDEAHQRAFVAHFAENTIGIIDLDPTSPDYHRVTATLGLPEPLL